MKLQLATLFLSLAQLDISYAKRDLRFMSEHGIFWYCLYLKYKLGFEELSCDFQKKSL